jgi:Tfp pilus assembly protein PilO
MIAVCILGVVFGIIPGIEKIVQMRNDIVALSNTVEQLKTTLSILNSNDESVYRAQLQELVAAVPSDKSLTTLFSTVDGLSAASGVTIADLSLTKPGSIATESAIKQSNEEKQIGSNILPFTVTVNGGYEQIYSFLSQVVNVRRFFRVRNFDISFVDTSNISVRMGMDAFYSPIVLNPTLLAKPLEPFTGEELSFITKIQAMPIVGQISLPPPTVGGTPTGISRTDPFSL